MTREERKEQADMRDEYHAMEERVAALEEERDELRDVVRDLLREAVILSDDYLSAFENEPMDHVIQGWDKARWIRASQAAKQARAALQEAEDE